MFSFKKNPFFSFTVIFLLLMFFPFSFVRGSDLAHQKIFKTMNHGYYAVILFAHAILPSKEFALISPEIVELDFEDNGTFTLKSLNWDEPAHGTYEKERSLIKAEGTTGIYYDEYFTELVKISYSFTGRPLGLRGSFMIGMGSREFIFLQDDIRRSENFIFIGPGN